MDFMDILNTPVDAIEPPKLLPVGTYTWTVTKVPEFAFMGANEDWIKCTFLCKCLTPEDDVDPDEIEAFGKVAGTPNRVEFIMPADKEEEQSRARTLTSIRRFLFSTLQVDIDESVPLGEAFAAAPNCQFLGVVTHVPDKNDSTVVREKITSFAPVD